MSAPHPTRLSRGITRGFVAPGVVSPLVLASVALSLAALAVLITAPSQARAAQVTTAVAASTSPITDSVIAFKQQVVSELGQYMNTYDDRLTASENARARAIVTKVGTQLDDIARATARAERLAAAKAPMNSRRSAAQAAVRAFDTGYATSQAALAEMTPILQPKLNLIEALGAKSTFDREMGRFQQLGSRIKALAADQRV